MNNENNSEVNAQIKAENEKALGPFLIILILAMIGGGVLGGTINSELINWSAIGAMAESFIINSSFVILIGLAVVGMIVTLVFYYMGRSLYRQWNPQEDDAVDEEPLSMKVSKKFDYGMCANSIGMVLVYGYFGIYMYSMPFVLNPYQAFLVIGVFLVFIAFTIIMQQKFVDMSKRMEPDKKGSVYDMKFSDKWEESCDEAEKLMIYKSGYKAYKSVNMVCVFTLLVTILGNMAFGWGIVPIVMITFVWLVSVVSYCKAAMKVAYGK